MLILISPAKTLDYQSPLTTTRYTLPELLDNSQQLIHEARKLTPPQISSLMRISDKLAGINAARFHDWQPDFTPENARQAILAFKGDVYTGLQAETFSEDDKAALNRAGAVRHTSRKAFANAVGQNRNRLR